MSDAIMYVLREAEAQEISTLAISMKPLGK